MLVEKYKLLEHKLEDKENVKTNGATAHTAATTTTKTTISNDEKVVIALDEFKKSFAQSSEVSPTGGITLEDYDKLSIKEKMSKFSKITKAANGTTYTLYLAGLAWFIAHREGKKLGDKLNEARRFDKKHKRQTAVTMKNNFNKIEEEAYNAYKYNKQEKNLSIQFYKIVNLFGEKKIQNKLLNMDIEISYVYKLIPRESGETQTAVKGGSRLYKLVNALSVVTNK